MISTLAEIFCDAPLLAAGTNTSPGGAGSTGKIRSPASSPR